jgi:hypothetical protein
MTLYTDHSDLAAECERYAAWIAARRAGTQPADETPRDDDGEPMPRGQQATILLLLAVFFLLDCAALRWALNR